MELRNPASTPATHGVATTIASILTDSHIADYEEALTHGFIEDITQTEAGVEVTFSSETALDGEDLHYLLECYGVVDFTAEGDHLSIAVVPVGYEGVRDTR